MTISTSQATEIFLGNNTTSTFSFTFVGDSATYITVIYTDENDVVTTLDPSQYTLFLNPPAVGSLWGVGGTVTYTISGSPIPTGSSLTITRTLPLTQTTSISNQGSFAPEVIEQALDTLELQIQQISGRTGQDRGTWVSGVFYNFGDYVIDGAAGANTGNYYSNVIPGTSGTWSTDLSNGDWVKFIDIQAIDTAVASAEAAATSASGSATAASNSATAASNSASTASTQASNAATSAAASAASATTAASYAASLSSTSSTSLAIGTGTKNFTTQASKQYSAGQYLIIASNADATNYMHGTVTTYSGTSLIMNITDVGGSGTFADWNISLSGTQGPKGATGPSGGVTSIATTAPISGGPITTSGTLSLDINSAATASIATGDLLIFADVSNANAIRKDTVANALALQTNGMVLLNTQTASNSTAINFDNTLITSTYKKYIILMESVVIASSGHWSILVSENNGTTIRTTAGDYAYQGMLASSSAITAFGNDSSTSLDSTSADPATGTGFSQNGMIEIYNPSNSGSFKDFHIRFTYRNSANSNNFAQVVGAGQYKGTTNAINYIRITANTHNFSTGTFSLYGMI